MSLKKGLLVIMISTAAGFVFPLLASAAEPAGNSIRLTLADAIQMALTNNQGLRIERLNPDLKKLEEAKEKAEFDFSLESSLSTSKDKGVGDRESESTGVDIGVSKRFALGTEVGIAASTSKNTGFSEDNPYSTHLGLSVVQPLFKGSGSSVNLAGLRRAELDTRMSLYELQDYTSELVLQVEQTYWDYLLTRRSVEVYEESMRLAEEYLGNIRTMIEVGKMAEIELVAAEAEVALRKENLVNARGEREISRMKLLRLLNPRDPDFWDSDLVPAQNLAVFDLNLGRISDHIQTAKANRPDLNQAKLSLEKNELTVIETENGLLPALDLFLEAGRTGYADDWGQSASDLTDDGYDVQVGIRYTYRFGRESERARYRQSQIEKEQAVMAVENLELLVQQDLRQAWIEIEQAREQITASQASRTLQEEKLKAETEKHRVGKSSSLLVAQAQRDLLSSQLTEVKAIAGYLKSISDFFRLEGTLLANHGISVQKSGLEF